jgi:sugar-specific transcriptional regulator TrmB
MLHHSDKKEWNDRGVLPGRDSIPPALISSLNTLGLSNDEARVYATLVLLDYAEAKEIVEHLSLSKPSVYKALENLDARGLAIKQRSKPARYRAISPEMALSILMRDLENAQDQALSALKTLEQENVRTDRADALWTLYGAVNIEYKMKELFKKARNNISCVLGDRYIQFLENVPDRDVHLRLLILSSYPGLLEKIQRKFPGENAEIHIIPLERLSSPPPGITIPEIGEAWKFLKFENVLEVNIDDEELLMSAAFFGEHASVLNTRNKGAIIQIKMFYQLFWNQFLEGEGR